MVVYNCRKVSPDKYTKSSAIDLNDSCHVVGLSEVGRKSATWLWTGKSRTILNDLFVAKAISNTGIVVGSVCGQLPFQPAPTVYDEKVYVNWLPISTSTASIAAISPSATFMIGTRKPVQNQIEATASTVRAVPCIWVGLRCEDLLLLPGFETALMRSVNDSGIAVGSALPAVELWPGLVKTPIWWSNEGIQQIPSLPNCFGGEAYAVNERGQIVGTFWDRSADGVMWGKGGKLLGKKLERGFLFENGVTTELATAYGIESKGIRLDLDIRPLDINNTGSVVGMGFNSEGEHTGFLMQGSTIFDLNTFRPNGAPWRISAARRINSNGVILCEGEFDGHSSVMLLSPHTAN